MIKSLIVVAILAFQPVLSFADGTSARIAAYYVIATCAAQNVGLGDRTQVDVSRPTNHFFGDIPTAYNRCAVPRLKAAGIKATELSLGDYQRFGPQELAAFINEIAVRSL